MSHHLVIRVVAKLLIPFILLFGLYVQFHGDFGPGGGFQAGVIFAAAFILYALVYGLNNARRVLPDHWIRIGAALGLIIFIGTGCSSATISWIMMHWRMIPCMASITVSSRWNSVSA